MARRLAGLVVPPGRVKAAATTAAILGLLRSFPVIRNGLRHLLGTNAADLAFGAASVVTLALSGSPLGLTVTGLEGLLLLTEVRARRAAWRRHEERLQGVVAAEPGAVIRLEAGERVPLEAEVIEGTGTAIGRDGLPRRITPRTIVSAGAELAGGPFVLQLQGGKPFLPQPRPAPLAPTLYTRYLGVLGPVSFGYAALTAVLTRSVGRTFNALLLVNPRTAIIGMEAANLDAAGRALRAGVTVVGTRPDRTIRLPDVLLLDGPRVLADGLEITTVLPVEETLDATQVLALAGGVAVAAGSPWGSVFPRTGNAPAAQGSFNGLWAAAAVQGQRYTLGPPEDSPDIGEAVEWRHRGGYLLMLSREQDDRPLGFVALRPRPAAPGSAAAQRRAGNHRRAAGGRRSGLRRRCWRWPVRSPGRRTRRGTALSPPLPPRAGKGGRGHRQPRAASMACGPRRRCRGFAIRWVRRKIPPAIGEAVERRHQGGYLLVLSREEDCRPLGFIAVRPRLNPGTARLVQTCRRLGVRLEMLAAGGAGGRPGRRCACANVTLVASADAVAVLRDRQTAGALVAFVSDSAQAAPAFADCDLAIGLAPAPTHEFPARADLLAADLEAVTAVLEAACTATGRSATRWDSRPRPTCLAPSGASGAGRAWSAPRTVFTSARSPPWRTAGCGCVEENDPDPR